MFSINERRRALENTHMTKSCIVLLSGGLDSLLTLRLMARENIRVTALHSVNCFHGVGDIETKKEHLRTKALALGASEIVFPDISETVVALTKNPRHGYGKHLNACIDCRLHTVRRGFTLMEKLGADFVASGEVVGQRPMSQRRDAIRLADREIAAWGHEGLFLRPLSAKLLEETVPQREGWVSGNALFDISGRGRERQMALAEELGIGEYPGPGGGCLLTVPEFSWRLAVLMRSKEDWGPADIELLKVGRHFQIAPDARIVASRNEGENYRLRDFAEPADRFYINGERNGAVVMLRGEKTPEAVAAAAGLAVYYSKMREQGAARVESWRIENGADIDQLAFPAAAVNPDALRERELALAGRDCIKKMRMRKTN